MIRVRQLKLPVGHSEDELKKKAAKMLKIPKERIKQVKLVKRSIDARKKPELFYSYTLDITVDQEARVLKKVNNNNIMLTIEKDYQIPPKGTLKLSHPPVIAGSGPAGLFCAYLLAQAGYAPIVIERGKDVQRRRQDVDGFWRGDPLDPESNVQFGEGGAGTFSDGKLNTLVKDPMGRSKKVLETFVAFGAPKQILYDAKPHIGTDILIGIVEKMRKSILAAGGCFLFETCLAGFDWEQGRLASVTCRCKEGFSTLETDVLVLAIGHSARDTFALLEEQGFSMEAKAFATGFRVEHPQRMINERQYGPGAGGLLSAAPYKLTASLANGRGAYSFCMCPGGYVVNASSEPGKLAVNGMSYSARDGKNANSAIIVTVTPKDFAGTGPLSGVRFQQKLERKAYELGSGRIPQQLLGDFIEKKVSHAYGEFESAAKGGTAFAPLHELFSGELTHSFLQGMEQFSKIIPGFDRKDCILSGVESRTSSPVRITRNEEFESNRKGVYPCGEGAGYAGGIMSAAMDGLKVAEAILRKYYR